MKLFICALPIAVCLACSAIAAEPPVTSNPAVAGDGVQVGVGKRDGITVSGREAYVTKNGATEKLTKDLVLPSGVVARPDGTIVSRSGAEVPLRASQLLTFDGTVVEIPPDPNVNPAPPSNVQVTTEVRSTAVPTTANVRVAGADLVFLAGNGQPFMGTIAADGSVVRFDGTVIVNDGNIRVVNFATDGSTTLGRVNANGTVTRADGSVLLLDGSVRAANGTVITGPHSTTIHTEKVVPTEKRR